MNIARETLYTYATHLTASERRFLSSISCYHRLSFAQNDVARTIRARARRRFIRGW